MALPVGAKAAGSLVTLVDSTSSTQARVDAATGGLRVGGITNKIMDRSGSFTSLNQVLVFTTGTSPYSKVRIFATSPNCAAPCITVSIDCVEGSIQTCFILSGQSVGYDQTYNSIQEVPGRTLRITLKGNDTVLVQYRVVVYGHAP
jgi:hypothetical protein